MAKPRAIKLQRDIDDLLAGRKPLAVAGKRSRAVSAFYYIRPLEENGAEPLLFLFHAAKRGIPNSHDRNKQKRRMRQAVSDLAVFEAVASKLRASSRQALVLLRTVREPSAQASWEIILADLEVIGKKLEEVIGA